MCCQWWLCWCLTLGLLTGVACAADSVSSTEPATDPALTTRTAVTAGDAPVPVEVVSVAVEPPLSLAPPLVDSALSDPQSAESALDSHLSWTKGDFTLTPYGAFWSDMIYATQRINPGAYVLWVYSEQEQGESMFTYDARRSQLGLDVRGPDLDWMGQMTTGGKLEIDFHGDFLTENRAALLLRLAYWEAKNDESRILVGQYWDVVSPLLPGMLDYSVAWDAGNIGFRRAQVRWERYLPLSDQLEWTLQASVNQDVVTDFQTQPGIRREPSNWPVIEGRTALTWDTWREQTATLGVSGHIGETGFDFLSTGPPPLNLPPADDQRFLTWSANVDLKFPFSERTGVQGEFFTGANLSSFLGGIGQGVCPCVRRSIRSTGGWGEIWHNWSPRLHSHVGYGLDDPLNRDFLVGRSYNQVIFANLVFDVNKHLTTGLEVGQWMTFYRDAREGQVAPELLGPTAPGRAVTIDWMIKYAF